MSSVEHASKKHVKDLCIIHRSSSICAVFDLPGNSYLSTYHHPSRTLLFTSIFTLDKLTMKLFNILTLSLATSATCFTPSSIKAPHATSCTRTPTSLQMASKTFEIMVNMPPSNSGLSAQMKIQPILGSSELIEVRYQVPFGLNVEPQKGLAVCTQDGTGGEKVGDILRYSSAWTMGLPRGDGIMTTAASFSGGIGWQCNLFDVAKAASWEQVVEALVSNTQQRTDEVLLIFERNIEE